MVLCLDFPSIYVFIFQHFRLHFHVKRNLRYLHVVHSTYISRFDMHIWLIAFWLANGGYNQFKFFECLLRILQSNHFFRAVTTSQCGKARNLQSQKNSFREINSAVTLLPKMKWLQKGTPHFEYEWRSKKVCKIWKQRHSNQKQPFLSHHFFLYFWEPWFILIAYWNMALKFLAPFFTKLHNLVAEAAFSREIRLDSSARQKGGWGCAFNALKEGHVTGYGRRTLVDVFEDLNNFNQQFTKNGICNVDIC